MTGPPLISRRRIQDRKQLLIFRMRLKLLVLTVRVKGIHLLLLPLPLVRINLVADLRQCTAVGLTPTRLYSHFIIPTVTVQY